jgi:hypothetical protein
MHVFLIPLAESVTPHACTCGHCGGQFPCAPGQYKEIIPAAAALSLTMDGLLERSNPALKDELEWSRRSEEFATDPRFGASLKSLDDVRPPGLGSRLKEELRHWGELNEGEREELVRVVDESARTMRFLRSIAAEMPNTDGCLIAIVTCLAVWAVSLLLPDFGIKALWRVIGVFFVGVMAGTSAHQFLLGRRVRQWTHDVLIPEGRTSGVDFPHLAAVLDDLPPAPRSGDVLHSLRGQVVTIRAELALHEVKGFKKPTLGADPDGL